MTPLGDKGYEFFDGYLHINMYTAPGWTNVLLGILNFVLFLPCIFKEQKIAAREAMVKQNVESGRLKLKILAGIFHTTPQGSYFDF